MSVSQTEGLIGYEWEADRLSYCGLAPVVVNATGHLWRVSFGPGEESTRWLPLGSSAPFLALHRPTSGLGASGFIRGQELPV